MKKKRILMGIHMTKNVAHSKIDSWSKTGEVCLKPFKCKRRGLVFLWVTVATHFGTKPISDNSVMWHMKLLRFYIKLYF